MIDLKRLKEDVNTLGWDCLSQDEMCELVARLEAAEDLIMYPRIIGFPGYEVGIEQELYEKWRKLAGR